MGTLEEAKDPIEADKSLVSACGDTPTNTPADTTPGSPETPASGKGDARVVTGMCCATVLAVGIPDAVLIGVFSIVGSGPDVFNAVADKNLIFLGNCLAAICALWLIILFLIDFFQLPALLQVPFGLILASLFLGAVTLRGVDYPWGIVVVGVTVTVVLVGYMRAIVFSKRSGEAGNRFYKAASISFGIVAVVILVVWIVWMATEDHYWNASTKDWLASKHLDVYDFYVHNGTHLNYTAHCLPDVKLDQLGLFDEDEQTLVMASCRKARTVWFVQWANPFIVFIADSLCAGFCFLFSVTTHSKVPKNKVAQTKFVIKRFTLIIALMVAFMYSSLYVSGANLKLGSAILCLAAAATTVLLGWMYFELDKEVIGDLIKQTTQNLKKNKSVDNILRSDWMRAFMVGGIHIFIPFMALLDMLRQKIRRCRGTTTSEDAFTDQGRRIADFLNTWNWCSIFQKVIFLAEVYLVMLVGSKVTFVLFSFLNEEIKRANLAFGIIALLVLVIGWGMFMCPIVPGSAVYLFAGVVLGAQAQAQKDVGFWVGVIVACVCGSVAKLIACVGQYLLGYSAGKSVKVQQFVGVDKVPTRAMEKVLKQKGMKIGKVCILVAGPDFPTSMLCGILQLSIPQMLLGTAPVILVSIVPQTLVGALLAKDGGSQGIWALVSTAATGVAAAFQAGATLIFTWAIMKTVETSGDELAQARPEHAAVALLTQNEKAYKQTLDEVCKWDALSCGQKTLLLLAVCCFLCAGFATSADFMLQDKYCFRSFAITDNIGLPHELGGLDGRAYTLVMPVGAAALGAAFFGFILNYIFGKWTARAARKRLMAVTSDDAAEQTP